MKTDIELVSIGTELLSGRTLNSHAQTLGAALSAIGLRLSRDTTVPDEIETIQSVVKEAFARADIVIVSGGLGPTSDDITREALAALYGRKIILSPEGLEAMRARFARRGITMIPVSERMAQILEGAEPLINNAGAAVAQRFFPNIGPERSERGSAADAAGQRPEGVAKTLFIVPGPPNEFAAVLTDHIVPWLLQHFPEAKPLELRVLTTEGIGESGIVTLMEETSFQCPEISIGFYPGLGKVEIRLTAPHDKKNAINQAERILRGLLKEWLV